MTCRNVLSLAIRAFPSNVDLATTYISFEAMHDVHKARKLAKELLKQNRLDLRLWNGASHVAQFNLLTRK